MYRSFGLIEVIGFVTATACIDTMVKSAFVELHDMKRTGSGMITIIIKGDLASVKEALQLGAETAHQHGEVVAMKVIARPYPGLERLLDPEEKGEKE